MILCDIRDASRYYGISEPLTTALKWVAAHIGDNFTVGSLALPDVDVVVNSQEPVMVNAADAKLEAHRRFIDIHVPLLCNETIGWAPVETLGKVEKPYDADADFELFGDSSHSLIVVRVGQIAIFFPEDAHAPNIGEGTHRKLCVKVPV